MTDGHAMCFNVTMSTTIIIPAAEIQPGDRHEGLEIHSVWDRGDKIVAYTVAGGRTFAANEMIEVVR